ncbi:short-chain dehydrogenase/reductase SDR [Listeria floridensis FSL S10-1187]|uniref:Short-chain dehydrogenase/reductase SDR n=1 Tax=Listeria floridensis FSL S10-1187 TaxID=1265817 RepID=A0ABN0RD47_9LIST|nr:glucose 1-dehydrogenase [Listeria floridensis]EUJ28018.1 short-chain dehydrogenase/reductase SDR [Listeria floridensis FSL S10-1187]
MRLKDKVAIITGAAGGQGKAEALLFAKEGAIVIATDMQKELLDKTGEEIKAISPKSEVLTHNVASDEDWKKVIDLALEKFGRVDILVNNAGISTELNIVNTSIEKWDQVLDVNLKGTFLGMRHVIPLMEKNGGGSIVNISSIAGLTGGSGASAYTASKGAVRLLTKAVAVDYAKQNIRCNSVHPGYIETPMTKQLFENEDTRGWFQSLTPLPRLGQSIDIAYGVLYLASDESSFVTGIELPVDGGYYAQ